MKITRPEHDYSILFHEDGTLYLTVKADDDEIIELEGTKGYLYYYSECVDEEDIDASPRLTLEKMQNYARECFGDWNVGTDAIESLVCDLTPWFRKFAISEAESKADRIAELESWIDGRRETIQSCVKRIDSCRHEISVYEQRIGYEVSQILKLNEDIEDIAKQIAELKASLKGEKFVSVDPEYTGGGIYVFTGKLVDGNYFMADTACYDVRIVDTNPTVPDDMSDDEALEKYGITRDEDAWASSEWQEAHLVKDLTPDEAVTFFKDMLKWVKANQPDGNYINPDMELIMEELDTLKGNWR